MVFEIALEFSTGQNIQPAVGLSHRLCVFKETASVSYSCRELYDRWTSAVSIKGIYL